MVGKVCPYCQTTIKPGENIIVCPVARYPITVNAGRKMATAVPLLDADSDSKAVT